MRLGESGDEEGSSMEPIPYLCLEYLQLVLNLPLRGGCLGAVPDQVAGSMDLYSPLDERGHFA